MGRGWGPGRAADLTAVRRGAVAYAICLAPALLVALGQPIWSRVDEAQHADYVAQLAAGVYPVEAETTIRPEIAAEMARTGIFRWNLPGRQPLPATRDASQFTPIPSGLTAQAVNVWVRRHLWWFSYEAFQPPLYYLLAAPIWKAASAVAGVEGGIYAARVFNALLLGALGPMCLALSSLMFPDRPRAAWAAVVMTALLPGLLLNGTQVSNDTLAAALGAAAVLAMLAGTARRWPIPWAALAGLLLGLSVLAKLTAVGLALPLGAALLWTAVRRDRPWPRQALAAAVAGGVAAAVVGPWLLLNVHLYGDPLPALATRRLLGVIFPPHPLSPGYVKDSLFHAFSTFWTGEPHDSVPLHRLVTYSMGLWFPLAGYGVVRQHLKRGGLPGSALLWLGVLAGVGELAWAVVTLQISGIGGQTPGRYLYPAVAPTVVAWMGGFFEAIEVLPLRALGLALFGAFSIVNVGGYLAGHTGFPAEQRAGPGRSAVIQPVRGSGAFGGFEVTADRVAYDSVDAVVWVHLTAVNRSGGPADWWPVVYLALPGRGYVQADYARSSPFPETLADGEQVTGWSRLDTSPDGVDWHSPLRAKLVDVAIDGYRHVGVVPLVLTPVRT